MLAPLRIAAILVMLAALVAPPAAAQTQPYSAAELQADAARLRNAVQRIYAIGLKPAMTPEEVAAIGEFDFTFPMPREGDDLLNFAATTDGRYLIMPLASLKLLEDMTTAYAWLYQNGFSASTIDLYFAALRYREPDKFPGGRMPKILPALGVPDDANSDKKVDEISLGLRNEAIAFIIAHELGHIRHRHKPLDEISSRDALADEIQSDRFALDLMQRTSTPPLGALYFFQAQLYMMLHRHEFATEADWRRHVRERMTHPVNVDRVKAIANFLRDEFPEVRPTERQHWQWIGNETLTHLDTMTDIGLGRCLIRIVKDADLAILKPRKAVEDGEILGRCRGVRHE